MSNRTSPRSALALGLTAAAALMACAHERVLDGAWQSVPGPGSSQGEIVHLYKDDKAMVVFDGECGPVEEAAIEPMASGEVMVRFFDDAGQVTVRRQYFVEGDTLYVPVRTTSGREREAFQRVDQAAVLRRYGCAAALLEP